MIGKSRSILLLMKIHLGVGMLGAGLALYHWSLAILFLGVILFKELCIDSGMNGLGWRLWEVEKGQGEYVDTDGNVLQFKHKGFYLDISNYLVGWLSVMLLLSLFDLISKFS